MRGITRDEKLKAQDFYRQGLRPAEVYRLFEAEGIKIPLSTLTTWFSNISICDKSFANHGKRILLRDFAKEINEAEAKIVSDAGKILDPDISDNDFFSFQNTVTLVLQNLVLYIAKKMKIKI